MRLLFHGINRTQAHLTKQYADSSFPQGIGAWRQLKIGDHRRLGLRLSWDVKGARAGKFHLFAAAAAANLDPLGARQAATSRVAGATLHSSNGAPYGKRERADA